jgi:hypothetical protein
MESNNRSRALELFLLVIAFISFALPIKGEIVQEVSTKRSVIEPTRSPYFYQNHLLTSDQYHHPSIRLKLDFESNRTDLFNLHRYQLTFFDILNEVRMQSESGNQTQESKLFTPPQASSLSPSSPSSSSFHLRGSTFMIHNNKEKEEKDKKTYQFLELSVYSDEECSEKVQSVGRLINTCYNHYYPGSFLFQIHSNGFDKFIYQIEYSENNCQGTSEIIDLTSMTPRLSPTQSQNQNQTKDQHESEVLTECFNRIQWRIFSKAPSLISSIGKGVHAADAGATAVATATAPAAGAPAGVVTPHAAYGAIYSSSDSCDLTFLTNTFHGYDFRRGGVCYKVPRQTSVYARADVQGCEVKREDKGEKGTQSGGGGAITVNYYFDSSCEGSVAKTVLRFKELCVSPSWWEGDDQDDFRQENSNFIKNELHSDYCYDPSHSSTSPPAVTATCSSPYFHWIGDGFCDSSLNTPECNYDGGDCCHETCLSTQFQCGTIDFNCLNPNSNMV